MGAQEGSGVVELEKAKRKAAMVLQASQARKRARSEDEETAGLDQIKSKPKKKYTLTHFLSSPRKTSAGKHAVLLLCWLMYLL